MTELVSAREQPQPVPGAEGEAVLSVPTPAHSSLALLAMQAQVCPALLFNLGEGRNKQILQCVALLTK